MKKLILLSLLLVFSSFAKADISTENKIQTRIDSVATNILNANKIQKRMVFVYDKNQKKKLLSTNKTLTKRQIILYNGIYQFIQTDDELAGALSREISSALKSYSGMWGGRIDSLEVAISSKKFETVADKRAVDYMAKSGYNPLGLIVFINKTCPQKRSDRFSRHNLTSKRLARIYEYITYKYPKYLDDSAYKENKYYQNFLLNSAKNRAMLEKKIKTNSREELNYE